MPIPTIDLDTRRYPDFVDEARSLIPRYAPEWTNENPSDPGVTLIELFAFLTEQLVYRANRIPERHRRKLVQLVGFAPLPPTAARTVLAVTPGAGGDGLVLPAGLVFASGGVPFRTAAPLTVTASALVTAQVYDGTQFDDVSTALRQGDPIAVFGSDPDSTDSSSPDDEPALYLGFDTATPAGRELTLHVSVAGLRTDAEERMRITDEAAFAALACAPPSRRDCGPDDPARQTATTTATVRGRAIRTEWDVYDGTGWRTLDPREDEVDDETMAFTLEGAVRLRAPVAIAPVVLGDVAVAHAYVRCRLAAGSPDEAPMLLGIVVNAVGAEQRTPLRQTFAIAAGTAAPGATPEPGTKTSFAPSLDAAGAIVSLGPSGTDAPQALVLAYRPATASADGELTLALAQAGRGSGGPEQSLVLPAAPLAAGDIVLWTLETAGPRRWDRVADFDSAEPAELVFTLEPETGIVSFGNGRHGRVPPEDVPILARYESTLAAAGNIGPRSDWVLSGADDELNRALLGREPSAVQALIAASSSTPAVGGADAESLAHAAGRAAATLWSHERLVECSSAEETGTLDQVARADVLGRAAPPRVATLLDAERLALDVPGTRVGRARAFGGLDGRYPGLVAPGTVTVVIVAGLPRERPQPSQDLLDTVSAFLRRRKTLGTRLVVTGPTYIEVSVTTTLTLRAGADPTRVETDARAKLAATFDPLTGGPAGRGWPFGRDVYRSEMLQLLDGVDGVDHVDALELIGPDGASCGNVCIGPTALPASGTHTVKVIA